ncbi:MAG: hypothetical protein ACHP8A_02855 [Terriglobales bacterium]|jgi:hypothetical protein|nr:hypothetical protein [Terriglobales bacterium]
MSSTSHSIDREKLFRVRPRFLLGCAICLLVLILPAAIDGRSMVQRLVLVVASLAIACGWVFLWKYREPNQTWRALIALVSSLYLTISPPVFLFELAPFRWFRGHPALSLYAGPWVHWGYVLVLFGVAGSFFGRGRARIAFAVGATLLLDLWLSIGAWVH